MQSSGSASAICAAIFLIFVGCFFPLLLTAISAVHNIPAVYMNAGRNFGLSTRAFVCSRSLSRGRSAAHHWPADHPGHRVAGRRCGRDDRGELGLGFLIVDARNAGNRYDLVVAGMVIIGVIGLLLDTGNALARTNANRSAGDIRRISCP